MISLLSLVPTQGRTLTTKLVLEPQQILHALKLTDCSSLSTLPTFLGVFSGLQAQPGARGVRKGDTGCRIGSRWWSRRGEGKLVSEGCRRIKLKPSVGGEIDHRRIRCQNAGPRGPVLVEMSGTTQGGRVHLRSGNEVGEEEPA